VNALFVPSLQTASGYQGEVRPLHRQVYEALRTAILEGALPPGTRLPSTRALSEQLAIARSTVADAYDQLQAEGYLEGRRGSGTYVPSSLTLDAFASTTHLSPPRAERQPRLSRWAGRVVDQPFVRSSAENDSFRYDLRPHLIAADSFPWKAWHESVAHALRRDRERLVAYPPAAGDGGLREAIARHVAKYRAVRCSSAHVVIVNGAQQALHLITQLLLEPRDRVAVEDPGYPPARSIFEASGATVEGVPVDAEGMIVERVPSAAALVHVTPSHQHPTGAMLSLSRRLALLEFADLRDALIVEDDYDSEFRYEGRPVESLQGLDRSSRVVYIGTFSKSLLPGLRIGFVILPPHLVKPFLAAKSLLDGGSPMLDQVALAHFISAGGYERHVRSMRRTYRKRRDSLLAALNQFFGKRAQVGDRQGGLNVLVGLDLGFSEEEVVAKATEADIGLRGASSYFSRPPTMPTFFMGFAGLCPEEIQQAIGRLAALLA
jgi:GntR family transcriptional regulator / MocR family aminotransferase